MPGSWLDGGGNGNAVDVHDTIDAVATKALFDLVQLGALVSMGTTSDGGALAVTVTVDGKWRRDYFRSTDELTAWLAEAVPAIEELTGGRSPSAAPRSRARRSRAA